MTVLEALRELVLNPETADRFVSMRGLRYFTERLTWEFASIEALKEAVDKIAISDLRDCPEGDYVVLDCGDADTEGGPAE